MKSINKDLIIKNLNGILCAISILAILFPFCSIEMNVSVMGFSSDSSSTINGTKLLSDGGLWGIMIVLAPIVVLVASYLPQLEAYKKIICMGSSGIMILALFLVAGSFGASASGGSADFDMSVKYLIGFWIMLVSAVLIFGIAVIQFFNLKGNKVFSTVNSESSKETEYTFDSKDFNIKAPQINIDKDKISEMAQNMAGSISSAASNIAENVSSRATSKEKPDEIMEQIKKLFEMKEAGILTEEEFTTKKQELLRRL